MSLSEMRGGSGFYRWIGTSSSGSVPGTNIFSNGAALMVYSAPIQVGPDGSQICIFVNVVQATTAILVRLAYSLDGVRYMNKPVEEANAITGTPPANNAARQYNVNIKEWGPFSTSSTPPAVSAGFIIEEPIDFWYCKVGIYSNGATTAGDECNVTWVVQGAGQVAGPAS